MQLEKEKKEKQERERCRALAQRIAEEAAAASAALLGEQSLLLTKALRRAGVAAGRGRKARRQSFWSWWTRPMRRCRRSCPPGCCW